MEKYMFSHKLTKAHKFGIGDPTPRVKAREFACNFLASDEENMVILELNHLKALFELVGFSNFTVPEPSSDDYQEVYLACMFARETPENSDLPISDGKLTMILFPVERKKNCFKTDIKSYKLYGDPNNDELRQETWIDPIKSVADRKIAINKFFPGVECPDQP